MLFRGPLQAAMMRRIPVWATIVFVALLFAGIHLDIHGFPLRTILGILLGWIVWRTGSIFPAMIAHGLFDTTQLALAAYQIHHGGVSTELTTLDYWALAIGAVFILGAAVIWRMYRSPLVSHSKFLASRFEVIPLAKGSAETPPI
jgi:membrane protease YdiL (CAAX protease family)